MKFDFGMLNPFKGYGKLKDKLNIPEDETITGTAVGTAAELTGKAAGAAAFAAGKAVGSAVNLSEKAVDKAVDFSGKAVGTAVNLTGKAVDKAVGITEKAADAADGSKLSTKAADLIDKLDKVQEKDTDDGVEHQTSKLEQALKSPKKFFKKAVTIGAAGAVALSLLVPIGIDAAKNSGPLLDESVLNPTPIVMDIGDIPEDEIDDEDEDEKKVTKLSIIERLKLAVYGFFGAIGLWLGSKVPWKKILTKRNITIFICAAILAGVIYVLFKFNLIPEDYFNTAAE